MFLFFGMIFKENRQFRYGITALQALSIIICGLVLIHNIYFNSQERVDFTLISKVFLFLSVGISFLLIP